MLTIFERYMSGETQTTISQLPNHVGQTVALTGWLKQLRSSGKILFAVMRDGTGLCQCVLEKTSASERTFEMLDRLGLESAFSVKGLVRQEPRAAGGYELALTDAQVIHSSQDYPITPKPHGIDFLLKHRHLWLRSGRQGILMRIRHTLIEAVRQFFNSRGFTLIDTPILSPSAGEGASTLFEVDYFGKDVYLAQTGQLYLEAAAMALRKVYCLGPTFRAEKSKTRRHLTEFWMVEPEVAFIDLDGLMDLAEQCVCHIVKAVLDRHRGDLEFLGRDVSVLENIGKPFERISYDQAIELLHSTRASELLEKQLNDGQERISQLEQQLEQMEDQRAAAKKKWQQEKLSSQIIEAREVMTDLQEQVKNIPQHMQLAREFQWGRDLGGSDETIISLLHDGPVFVHRYPRDAKAFYMRADRSRDEVVENFDMLAPEGFGEIIGGSAREEDQKRLAARIKAQNMPAEPYQWYLDLRRYGSVPHGGFGLGIERTMVWICGLKHIREAIAFPRMLGKIYP